MTIFRDIHIDLIILFLSLLSSFLLCFAWYSFIDNKDKKEIEYNKKDFGKYIIVGYIVFTCFFYFAFQKSLI